MADDLIEKLWFCANLHPQCGYPENGKLFGAAADRITALQAQNRKLVEALEKANALLEASIELAQYASYAEMVGGLSVNRPQVRKWCDAVFEICRTLPEDENFDPTFAVAAIAEAEKGEG